jgi:hypothetical protein
VINFVTKLDEGSLKLNLRFEGDGDYKIKLWSFAKKMRGRDGDRKIRS